MVAEWKWRRQCGRGLHATSLSTCCGVHAWVHVHWGEEKTIRACGLVALPSSWFGKTASGALRRSTVSGWLKVQRRWHVTCYLTVNAFNETSCCVTSRTGRKPVNRDLCTLCMFEAKNYKLIDNISNVKPLFNHCTVRKRVLLSRTQHNRAWNQHVFTTVYTHKPEHVLIYHHHTGHMEPSKIAQLCRNRSAMCPSMLICDFE